MVDTITLNSTSSHISDVATRESLIRKAMLESKVESSTTGLISRSPGSDFNFLPYPLRIILLVEVIERPVFEGLFFFLRGISRI